MKQLGILLLGMGIYTQVSSNDAMKEKLDSLWPLVKVSHCEPIFGRSHKGGLNVTAFSCAKKGSANSGFLIWQDVEKPKLVWHRIRPGPTPHHFAWVDFDDDKKEDLFVLSGQEDVAWTEIYLNRGKTFQQILSFDKEYGVVVDADRDEKPDLFLASKREDEHYACLGLELSSSLAAQVKDKYLSISAKYKDANYTYEMPEDYPLLNMYMLQKIQILRFSKRHQKMMDETNRFQDHIAWRINLLEKLMKARDKIHWDGEVLQSTREECYRQVNSTIQYWKSRVSKPRGKRRGRRARS